MALRRNLSVPFRLALCGLLAASRAQAQATDPTPSTAQTPQPVPLTTTQERLVNTTGLSESSPTGWHTDFIGPFRGDFDASFGVKFFTSRFNLRNLIFGGTVDLLPGIRARAQFRRREGERQAFQIDSDEVYLEGFNQYRGKDLNFGANLRIGRIRYLHFPFPDAIAEFDQVPGITDLNGGANTDYRDAVLQGELAMNSGWGAHVTGLAHVVDGHPGAHAVEAYGFYRHDFGRGWHFEGRAGALAVRHEPLGRDGQLGANVYLGKQLGEINLGFLYENKRNEHEYGGIMLQFRPNNVTKALGHVSFDYSRTPEGFTVQIPLLHLRLRESKYVRPGDVLVGEVRAARIKTLWQQGFVRNQYEHRLESWGETGDPSLHCVVTEEPWYLEAEALVTPHLIPDARAERDRQGPGQFVQRVTYRYYRSRPVGAGGA